MEPAKARLQKLCSDRKLSAPSYRTKAVEGGFSSTVSVGIGKGKVIRFEAETAETSQLAEEAATEAFLGMYAQKSDIWWAVVRSKNDKYAQFLSEICQRMGVPAPRYRFRRGQGQLNVELCGRQFSAAACGQYPRDVRHEMAGAVLLQLGAIKKVLPRFAEKEAA